MLRSPHFRPVEYPWLIPCICLPTATEQYPGTLLAVSSRPVPMTRLSESGTPRGPAPEVRPSSVATATPWKKSCSTRYESSSWRAVPPTGPYGSGTRGARRVSPSWTSVENRSRSAGAPTAARCSPGQKYVQTPHELQSTKRETLC